jgi:hypothetical protein
MLVDVFNDVVAVFRATFLQGDTVSLAIAFGSALLASLLMSRGGQIGSMTLLALVLFIGGGLVRSFLRADAEGGAAGRAIGQLEAGWMRLMDMNAGTLVAYFVAFMAMVFIFFGLRSAVFTGLGGGAHH